MKDVLKLMLAIIIAVTLVFGLTKVISSINKSIQIRMEYAYFEGQKDVLEGDIKIVLMPTKGDTTWMWMESPWNKGGAWLYNPMISLEENGLNEKK